jgi:hypothetical protein
MLCVVPVMPSVSLSLPPIPNSVFLFLENAILMAFEIFGKVVKVMLDNIA